MLPTWHPVTDSIRGHRTGQDPVMPLRTLLARFLVTGGLAAVVDYVLYQLLLALGLGLIPAKALSFVAGTATAYAINRRWTFASTPSARNARAVFGLYAVTFLGQVTVNTVLVGVLPPTWWRITVAFVIAQGVATSVNFLVQHRVIFRR